MAKLGALATYAIVLATVSCAGPATTPSTLNPTVPALSVATVAPTTGPGLLRIGSVVGTDIRDVPSMMAFDALRAQGYTVEEEDLATSIVVASALARGDIDIGGLNNQTAWDAIANGANTRVIISRYALSPLIGAKEEIKTCGDLDGKSVALSGTSGYTPTLFDFYLKQNCPGSKPKILVIADAGTRTAALQSGEIDAAQIEPQDIVELARVAPGRFHTLVALEQAFPQLQGSGLYVRQDWAKQNPKLLHDFIRAMLQANRRVNENPPVLFSESVSRLGLDPAVAEKAGTMELEYNAWDVNGGMTPERVRYTLDFFAKIDPAIAGLGVEDVADLSYLSAVLDELGRK